MTEDSFRARFAADQRANRLTWVHDGHRLGIAIGLNGPEQIILHGGDVMEIAGARFVPSEAL